MKKYAEVNSNNIPWGTLCLMVFVLLSFSIPYLNSIFESDVALIKSGEWWRAVTGNFTHWSAGHLVWDLAAFVILGALIEQKSKRVFSILIFVSSVTVSLGVILFRPDILYYRGLSGVDCALFIYFVLLQLDESFARINIKSKKRMSVGDLFSLIITAGLLVGFAAKTIFETFIGEAIFVQDLGSGIVVTPIAHLLGGFVGLLVFLLYKSALIGGDSSAKGGLGSDKNEVYLLL